MDHVRLENHWLACMAAAGGGARITRTVGGLAVANPHIPGMAFNFIALRSVQPARLPAALDIGGTLLAACGRPPAVFLSPAAGDMAELGQALSDLGWRRQLAQSVLVRPVPAEPMPPRAPQITVEPVTEEHIPLWSQTLMNAYEVDPITAGYLTEAWESILRAPGDGARALGCLAWLEGRPAGTGLLWAQGGLAGLYCGAVLPELRRQGVHRALVRYRLAAATDAGCTMATLQTEEASPVERLCTGELGFVVAYRRELWAPAQCIETVHCV